MLKQTPLCKFDGAARRAASRSREAQGTVDTRGPENDVLQGKDEPAIHHTKNHTRTPPFARPIPRNESATVGETPCRRQCQGSKVEAEYYGTLRVAPKFEQTDHSGNTVSPKVYCLSLHPRLTIALQGISWRFPAI